MDSFYGMDTAQVEDFAQRVGDRSASLDDLASSLQSLIDAIVGSQWIGSDADAFGDRFRSETLPRFRDAVDQLRRRQDALDGDVEEQESASSVEGGGILGDIFGGIGEALDGVGDLFGGAVDFLGEVWSGFVDNLIPNVGNLGGVGVTVTGDIAGQILKSGGRALSSAVPLVGDAFTGVLAGVERWNQDSDLPFAERLGRSVLDGGVNALGSFVGGTAGSALGVAVGGLFGGGGGAAAGAPTGPGAILTGLGGGTIGGGIGFLVGDAVGSYVGGAAGDAVIDAILD
ncbi:WXG100 family type VII secretion target [Brachybacterium sp.]|uniref:WXG100 family type VII secretion target n=1 Tax=Brachybacterium sp. TaxID=1891286 RepID=UPI002ED00367